MTSETREIIHDQHSHPGWKFYFVIGVLLIFFTALEVVGYIGETKEWYSPGAAAVIILTLSGIKFFSVVAYYMHLKFDHKLFTAIFVFPALLGTLVIGGMLLLFHVIHGQATALHGMPGHEVDVTAPAAPPAAH